MKHIMSVTAAVQETHERHGQLFLCLPESMVKPNVGLGI